MGVPAHKHSDTLPYLGQAFRVSQTLLDALTCVIFMMTAATADTASSPEQPCGGPA